MQSMAMMTIRCIQDEKKRNESSSTNQNQLASRLLLSLANLLIGLFRCRLK